MGFIILLEGFIGSETQFKNSLAGWWQLSEPGVTSFGEGLDSVCVN